MHGLVSVYVTIRYGTVHTYLFLRRLTEEGERSTYVFVRRLTGQTERDHTIVQKQRQIRQIDRLDRLDRSDVTDQLCQFLFLACHHGYYVIAHNLKVG